jgi:hypothetical protein
VDPRLLVYTRVVAVRLFSNFSMSRRKHTTPVLYYTRYSASNTEANELGYTVVQVSDHIARFDHATAYCVLYPMFANVGTLAVLGAEQAQRESLII